MDKPRVSIGIPAYGAENRIQQLVRSVLNQKAESYVFHELIVHIDEFPDATRQKVVELNDPRIKIIETTPRKGYAHAMKRLFETNTGDVLITFNDDIKIEDANLVEKLVEPFRSNAKVGIVTGRPVSLPAQTFIEKAVASTDRIYAKARYSGGDYNNATTVDGKAMAFSNNFIENFEFPSDLKMLASVDSFFYFAAQKLGYTYMHVKDAVVFGRGPGTLKDYIRFNSRIFANHIILGVSFDSKVIHENYKINRLSLLHNICIEFIRNPFGLVAILFINRYVKRKAKQVAQNFNQTWDVVTTSKKL